MKRLVMLVLCASFLTAQAQETKAFRHLDLGVTGGSTGIGVELAAPINDYVRLRLGGNYMPHFHYNMTFTAQIGTGDQMTIDDVPGTHTPTRFEKMAELLEDFVGQPVDDKVDMVARPNMNQLKLLVDVMPFRNKGWHFTAGVFYGKSRIAQAINRTHETSSLFAINLYNRMYENGGAISHGISLPPEYRDRLLEYGRAGFPMGFYTFDHLYEEDVMIHDDDDDMDYPLHLKGDVIEGMAKGDPYLMGASNENTAYANVYVNRFRPFFGFGYEGAVSKDRGWRLGFDAGVLFWGGMPNIVDHAGVDLIHDVTGIGGQVGDYINLAKHMKAFPVLEFKITRRLF